MKLYRALVTKTVYVVADDILEAEQMAKDAAREDDGEPDCDIHLATERLVRRDAWGGALVYHKGSQDYRVEEALKLNQ